jgi:hypothetical protein
VARAALPLGIHRQCRGRLTPGHAWAKRCNGDALLYKDTESKKTIFCENSRARHQQTQIPPTNNLARNPMRLQDPCKVDYSKTCLTEHATYIGMIRGWQAEENKSHYIFRSIWRSKSSRKPYSEKNLSAHNRVTLSFFK